MKKLIFILPLIFLYCLVLVPPAMAQECYRLFPTSQGTSFTHTYYNAKGKVMSISEYTVQEYVETSNGYDIKLHVRTTDDKGKNLIENDYVASCTDGVFQVDMSALLNSAQMEQMQGMEMTLTGDMISLPANLHVGQDLPDASMEMNATSPMPMTMRVDMMNRKVAGEEKVNTPAGDFDCFIISYDQKMKFVMNMESSTKQWINAEVGMVRAEFYNKGGKMTGYLELSSLSK